MPSHCFIFAGGGTGGHLYPALAIAEQLAARLSDRHDTLSTLFLCSNRAVDARILSTERVSFQPLPAAPPSIRPLALWRFLSSWGPSIRLTRAAIREARARSGHARVRLITTGGFVAAPAVQAAIAERCPITLINLDAIPGRANRWMLRRVSGRAGSQAFTALPVIGPTAPRWTNVSPIVRAAARSTHSPAQARAALGLDPARPVLMVTGASLGAKTINAFLARFAAAHTDTLRPWQVLHQTGTDDNASLEQAYAAAGVRAVVRPFVSEMGLWWCAADLAIARAGAGLVAEVWANIVPTLFMPYPYHKDGHQRANPQALVNAGGAILCDDAIDPAANLASIGPVLVRLLADPAALAARRQALASLGPADGAARIADAILAATP